MFKRVIGFILCLIVSSGLFLGCSMVTHNYEKDYRRVIAEIHSIDQSGDDRHVYENGYYVYALKDAQEEPTDKLYYERNGVIYEKSGNDVYFEAYPIQKVIDAEKNITKIENVKLTDLLPVYDDWTYSFEGKKIYKTQLISTLNNSAASYAQENPDKTTQEITDHFVEQLLLREYYIIEADKLIASGKIIWRQADDNAVLKSIYSSIDSEIQEYYNAVLKEQGKQVAGAAEEEAAPNTTYPAFPKTEEPIDLIDEEKWDIKDESEQARWPAFSGSEETKSTEREAMRRYLNKLEETVRDDWRLTSEQKRKIDDDFNKINSIRNSQGIHMVYPMLMDEDIFTVRYLYEESAVASQKLALLDAYIQKLAEPDEATVLADYNRRRAEQQAQYDEDIAAYDRAVESEEVLLYNPVAGRHVFVKHILLQFTKAQQDEITNMKNKGKTVEEVERTRKDYANALMAHPHVDGEDDTTVSRSAAEVFQEVYSAVSLVQNNPKLAERTFDQFVYKYNQDPGMFQSVRGYAVKYKLDDGEADKYMKEFANAARELKDSYKIGQMLNRYIITDYGVHIMYYSNFINSSNQSVSVNDYVNPAEYKNFYDIIKSSLTSARAQNMFNRWQATVQNDYSNDAVRAIYTKAFKDLYK